jgi:hypothetical protein
MSDSIADVSEILILFTARMIVLTCILSKHGGSVWTRVSCTGFEVLTPVKMTMFVLWVVTHFGLVGRYQRFGETYCLLLQT